MKRRDFLHAVVTASTAAVVDRAEAQNPTPPGQVPGAPPPAPGAPVPGAVPAGTGSGSTVLPTVIPDTVASTVPGFFSDVEFATLRRLSDLLAPSINSNPGALSAGAPEFLDHYIGASGPERQQLYRTGLDDLNRQALARYRKPFAALTAPEADAIVRPLFEARGANMSVVDPGPFINRVHQDVRTITLNSVEYVAAQTASGAPPPPTLYWRKVDPTVLS
jgi:hypothetical protein